MTFMLNQGRATGNISSKCWFILSDYIHLVYINVTQQRIRSDLKTHSSYPNLSVDKKRLSSNLWVLLIAL